VKYPLGQKLYFSISEVAEITDLQPYILRTWEKEFTCLRPRRLRGKNRAYRQRDINLILLIKRLLYEERFTIQGVRQKLKNDADLIKEAVGKEGPDNDSEGTAQLAEAEIQDSETASLPLPDPVPAPPVEVSPTPPTAALGALDRQVLEEVKGQLREILRLLA
jgi:DNA-binding transcriptional MerR regulator